MNNNNLDIDDLINNLEFIAEGVHKEWMKEKVKQGWTFGLELNEKFKKHPSLVPYEQLSEEEKELDRRTIIKVINTLLELGYKITKK